MRRRHKHVVEKVHGDADAVHMVRRDLALQDFTFEWSEDNEPEVDVDVDNARAVANQSFGSCENVVQANAESDFVNHFVRVLGIDVVFDCLRAALFKVLRVDLNQIRNFDLNVICER